MEPTSSVRRPESGTWQSVAMETAAMGGRTGTHDTLWTWQQHEEAVQGPMQITGLAAAMGGARNLPAPYDKMEPTSSVRRPESGTWQSVCGDGDSSNGRPYRDP
ncbi:unnamed protein product [Staurois parvus]|uniref:Uncharacterized protein n=1 Tax=Staurois parvus TaxID=386267 RepID=A0ABN9E040_9NEOB|nr:unnamed protein product [Staurois parvus]